jgi:hypothetical protein
MLPSHKTQFNFLVAGRGYEPVQRARIKPITLLESIRQPSSRPFRTITGTILVYSLHSIQRRAERD